MSDEADEIAERIDRMYAIHFHRSAEHGRQQERVTLGLLRTYTDRRAREAAGVMRQAAAGAAWEYNFTHGFIQGAEDLQDAILALPLPDGGEAEHPQNEGESK